MHENTISDYSNICNSLIKQIQDLDVTIRVSKQNRTLLESYNEKIKKAESNITLCNSVIDTLKPMIDDIMTYITERKKESMNNINNAIRMAGDIIPDATEGIYFKMDGDDAWLATPDDLEVDDVEGGGFRQISSLFLRKVILQSNPDTLDIIFSDEAFSLVSLENTSKLSLYLNVLSQDMSFISIEQKPQIYSNLDATMYLFDKGEEFAEVTKSQIKNGVTDNDKLNQYISDIEKEEE